MRRLGPGNVPCPPENPSRAGSRGKGDAVQMDVAFSGEEMGLGVFVSFMQAFIFTVLSMIYISGAVTHAEEH